MKGYAYAGGGRRVTKVEISLDEGSSWKLAEIVYPEDLYRAVCYSDPIFGTLDLTERETSFCWCFWSYEVKVAHLAESNAIIVRAMDEGMCVQQSQMYWNATGMMNNWYFRVAITKGVVEAREVLHFEHPTMAGTVAGGWMERLKSTGQDILDPSFGTQSISQSKEGVPLKASDDANEMIDPAVTRKITMDELRAQDREKPWFVVKGEVYDGTPFLEEHPGGPDSILLVAGENATDDFMAIHSPEAKAKMRKYHIGTLVESNSTRTASADDSVDDSSAPFLHKSTWKDVTLLSVSEISPDSKIFRFALDKTDRALGLPVGQHVFVRLTRKNGETVQRAYTPVSLQDAQGSIDFLVKIYFPSSEYPQGGKMTMGFHELTVGDTVQIKGPIGSFIWEGNGIASWRGVKKTARNLGLICAGSGITPILQVLRAVLNDKEDRETKLWLLDSNRTEQDILCREELDALYVHHGQSRHLQNPPHRNGRATDNYRFLIHHTLSKPKDAETWSFSVGRINDEMLRAHLPPPDTPDALVLICGPDRLIKDTVQPGLQRIGWDTSKTLVIF
ncbi:hypothetical protein FRC20_002092 [Serendipita sp. 405]|nr:hypothetical protein FRC20_002092 [Serendipita sp. 405]